jgi:hypothetical protein
MPGDRDGEVERVNAEFNPTPVGEVRIRKAAWKLASLEAQYARLNPMLAVRGHEVRCPEQPLAAASAGSGSLREIQEIPIGAEAIAETRFARLETELPRTQEPLAARAAWTRTGVLTAFFFRVQLVCPYA